MKQKVTHKRDQKLGDQLQTHVHTHTHTHAHAYIYQHLQRSVHMLTCGKHFKAHKNLACVLFFFPACNNIYCKIQGCVSLLSPLTPAFPPPARHLPSSLVLLHHLSIPRVLQYPSCSYIISLLSPLYFTFLPTFFTPLSLFQTPYELQKHFFT